MIERNKAKGRSSNCETKVVLIYRTKSFSIPFLHIKQFYKEHDD